MSKYKMKQKLRKQSLVKKWAA